VTVRRVKEPRTTPRRQTHQPMDRLQLIPALTAATLVLAACSSAVSSGSAQPSTAPVAASPTLPASSTSSASPVPPTGAIVTLRVGDEEYRVLLTEEDDILTAEELAAGDLGPLIPVGTVVRTDDGGVNTGYGWHIDPASFEWAELTMEVCDGRPSYVEDGTLSGDTFCPWSAEVVSVEPAG
jgi:hypothetical protein